MTQSNDQGAKFTETHESRGVQPLRTWVRPSIETLPRLENLTLQTGAGVDSNEGFKYV